MGRILVAEDDAFMLRILSMWLTRHGHTVTETGNGIAAQAALMESPNGGFDFIVSDINMPGLNGIALAEWVRNELRHSTPMILLSSRCDQDRIVEQVKPLDVGVHAKPFSPARLVAEIGRRLELERHEGTEARRREGGEASKEIHRGGAEGAERNSRIEVGNPG